MVSPSITSPSRTPSHCSLWAPPLIPLPRPHHLQHCEPTQSRLHSSLFLQVTLRLRCKAEQGKSKQARPIPGYAAPKEPPRQNLAPRRSDLSLRPIMCSCDATLNLALIFNPRWQRRKQEKEKNSIGRLSTIIRPTTPNFAHVGIHRRLHILVHNFFFFLSLTMASGSAGGNNRYVRPSSETAFIH